MSRNQKLLFGGCIGVFLVCICACIITFVVLPTALVGMLGSVAGGFSDDPVKSKQVASTMADYTLPTGYQERGSLDVGLAKIVFINPPDEDGMAIIMGQATGISRSDIERMMREQMAQNADVQMRQVGTEQVTIKGKLAQMTIYESSGGQQFRQGVVGFDGKGGPVVLMFFAQISQWNKPVIDRFLSSIR